MMTKTDEISILFLWATEDVERQKALVALMAESAAWLAARPGFRKLKVRPSGDGKRVVVEGIWESQAAFDLAITHDVHAAESRAKYAAIAHLDEIIILPANQGETTMPQTPIIAPQRND